MKILKWNEIDYFLYFDYWGRTGHDKSLKKRQKNLSNLVDNLFEKKIEIFLDKKSIFNILQNGVYNLEADAEYLLAFKESKNDLLKVVKENGFQIIHCEKNLLKIYLNQRLIVIRLMKKKYYLSRIKKARILDCEVPFFKKYIIQYKLIYKQLQKIIKIYLKIRSRYLVLVKNYNKYKLQKNMNIQSIESGNIYKIGLKAFLNLKIESRNSPSWIVRRKHLNIVTKNKKFLKVKDIVNYLASEDKLEHLMSRAEVTKLDKLITGSISHSKHFWHSGDNYFLFSVYYQFKKDVVPYKKANDYIKEKHDINLYSREYFESLEPMSDIELISFQEEMLIEITDNHISSGKHRVFAMIGRLIQGKEYIPFNAKVY